jgi:putative flippase GtrA
MLLTEVANVHYLISNLIGIIAATLWNYLVNTSWTWR